MLTRELVAAAFPNPVADDRTAMPLMSPVEIDVSRANTLAGLGLEDDVWLFVYGSLMWKPEPGLVDPLPAALEGWRRSFCIWQWRYRGTREAPGLMMALDVGGSCEGILLRAPGPDASAKLASVWNREMIGRAYRPVWVQTMTERGPVRAVTFVADRESQRYAGDLPDKIVAKYVAKACGHIGPNAEYLLETYLHCKRCGIIDPLLENLQGLVAAELTAA